MVQDYVKAHSWFDLGAIKGDAKAVKNRDIVAKRMTSQQIAEAQKQVKVVVTDCEMPPNRLALVSTTIFEKFS